MDIQIDIIPFDRTADCREDQIPYSAMDMLYHYSLQLLEFFLFK